jgi:hypothetical protein
MSALEDEIIAKFRLLDHAARERVLKQIEAELSETKPALLSPSEWLKWARQFRAELQAELGADTTVNTLDMLNEVREERLNDLMGRD